jgi:uncharacterized membrane protein
MAGGITDAVFGGEPNLSWTERAVSVVLGLGIAAAGAKPRPNPLWNIIALAGGSYLALRGTTGRCPVKASLQGGGGNDRIAAR